jgi:hypothetical protein
MRTQRVSGSLSPFLYHSLKSWFSGGSERLQEPGLSGRSGTPAQKRADITDKAANKDKDPAANDLDAVAGNAEDDIGELIATVREKELLYGERSLLKVYGPMIVAICASPRRYKVSSSIDVTCYSISLITLFFSTSTNIHQHPSSSFSLLHLHGLLQSWIKP